MFCEKCENTCCDGIEWTTNKYGKPIPLNGILLNHPALDGIRLVQRPDGKHRCMELSTKNKCTRYDSRPYICRDYHCNVLRMLGFNLDGDISDIYINKVMEQQHKTQNDYRRYIMQFIYSNV